ncbi:protein kinase domain-containing protein [Microvirga lotononidis]|uniref:non-specific serine/threonine protein kinase n=1 Tax=Microvirga lotononidis TaxID=864069 RepID=I4YS07_9HYPH|nr:protein kinase [Microvirga lotononidis]EIM26749.1 serine/threonine protein kinase [Microvirga lotononidis]WQO31660.1 protein kinase [Microvirga lotononidis]
MAKKLKVGDRIRQYRVTKVFGPGMMAISYGAEAPTGVKIFLKQYKSPAPTVVWYKAFVAYQNELGARVRNGRAAQFAVRQVDAFEEVWGGPCYFQAFEFVENGADLQQMLDEEREQHRRTKVPATNNPAVWARHVTWAKVFMTGMAALHESKVVHADLKPANAYLIEDPTISSGYQLKLIDMDFSLLADRRAPWHGHQGYVGTDNYRSPEHMTRGGVPGLASDVFTCGLMLYELLAGYHPYWVEDQAEYAQLIQNYAAKPPALAGVMPAPASNAEVSSFLHRCLAPDPVARPTAAELRAVLSGRGAGSSATKVGSAAGASAPRAAAELILSDRIELLGPDGRSLQIGVRTELGKTLVRQFGPDSEFWDNRQCVLERHSGRQWVISPVAGSTNETLVNGAALTAPRPLRQGDRIAVGRQAKGIEKMPLTAWALT